MSSAYNSKILTFPGMKLQEILMYRDIEKLSADCKLFNLSFANENVQFQAIKFNKDIQLVCFIERLGYIRRLTQRLYFMPMGH